MSGRGMAWPTRSRQEPKGEHRMHGYATRVSVITILALLLGLLVVFSVSLGASRLPFRDVIAALFGAGEDQTSLLIHKLRLPRVLVAALVGSALGAAGAVMQGVFRNPLASPDIMGVNGGASVAAVAFLTLTGSRYSIYWLPAVAIAGAFIAAALIYLLGWKRGASPIRLVLIGVGIATAMSALTTFLLISGPAFKATQVLNWLSGTIYGLSTPHLLALLPWVAVLLPSGGLCPGILMYWRLAMRPPLVWEPGAAHSPGATSNQRCACRGCGRHRRRHRFRRFDGAAHGPYAGGHPVRHAHSGLCAGRRHYRCRLGYGRQAHVHAIRSARRHLHRGHRSAVFLLFIVHEAPVRQLI